MALSSQRSLTRRRLGVIVAVVLCAVLLSLSRTPAIPGVEPPGTGEGFVDGVEEASPVTAPAPLTLSHEKTVAMAMAEQQLLSFSSTLGDVLRSDEIDVALVSTSINDDPPTVSLVDVESDLESELFGAESMFFASAGDLAETPTFPSGGLSLANRMSGIVAIGGGSSGSGGSGGGGISGGIHGGQNAGSTQNGVATNDNTPNGSAAGNGSGDNSGNGSGTAPGNSSGNHSENGPASSPGSNNGNSGHASGGDSGPSDELPLPGGPRGLVQEPSDHSTTPMSVPEPSVLSLVGVGLAGLATMRRRAAR